jgi:putative NADPH-quinone reductase
MKRTIQWWLSFPSTFVTWSDGVYSFNLTGDYQYTKELTKDISQYKTIDVSVFSMEYPKVIVPIRIEIVSV